jgi:phospholipid/cholesterol/gamma-HCH transport system substrate-binding protein
METRANNILIGAFVLVGMALAVAFWVWIARTGDTGPKKQFFVVFSGSVQGLGVGGSVLFNGLRVGEVNEIRINPGNRSEIRARITVDELTPVKRDTRVRLTYQGLTGVGAIELSGGTEQAGDLVPGADGVPPAMFAERSFVQNILEGGQDTLSRVNSVIQHIDDLVQSNQAAISATVRNIQGFSEALTQNNQAVSTMLADASIAARRVADLSARLEAVAEAIDPRRVGEIVDGMATIVNTLAEQREQLRRFVDDVSRAARNIAEASDRLPATVQRVDEIFAAVDPASVQRSVEGVERSVQNIERFAGAVGAESDRVKRIIDEAGEVVAALRRAAGSVENVAGSVGGGEGGAGGVVNEITETARSIRAAAENLDRRVSQIVGNLDRFTGPGLRDLQSLVADGRRILGNMDRVMRDLERNPQQFIFGRSGSGVPEFRR